MQKGSVCAKSLALQVSCKASWEKGASWFTNHRKNEPGVGGSIEQDRAISSAGTVGWDGALPSQLHPSFTGSLLTGTSWSGLGARNLGPD